MTHCNTIFDNVIDNNRRQIDFIINSKAAIVSLAVFKIYMYMLVHNPNTYLSYPKQILIYWVF